MACHIVRGDFSRDFFEVDINIFNTAHFYSRSFYLVVFEEQGLYTNIQFLLQGSRAILIDKDQNPMVRIIS